MMDILPNDQLEQLELVEDFTVEMEDPDACPLHARPGCQAEIEAVLQWALADGEASLQLGTGYRGKTIFPVEHWIPPSPRLYVTLSRHTETPLYLRPR